MKETKKETNLVCDSRAENTLRSHWRNHTPGRGLASRDATRNEEVLAETAGDMALPSSVRFPSLVNSSLIILEDSGNSNFGVSQVSQW